MSQTLIICLSDAVAEALRLEAKAVNASAEDLASAFLERRYGPGAANPTAQRADEARRRFERHFGSLSAGQGADNEAIDADLAREYGEGG